MLYRKFGRLHGIDIRKRPEYNLRDWLDRNSRDFKPALQDAIFHYAPRIEKDERLKLCIATPEMNTAAWRYGHNSQIVLDGTFGIVSSHLLLFIVLGVDEQNHGLPLVFLLFSAPSGSRATHAGYCQGPCFADVLNEYLL